MSNRPPPRGQVSEHGYRRITVRGSRKQRMEHVLVWEAARGPVPPGMELHHINGDKLDNRLENLQLVTRLEHKRIHSGCILKDGDWLKPCRRCGEFKPIDCYYLKPDGITSMCKPCLIRRAVWYKQLRRARLAERRAATGETPQPTAGAKELEAA